MIPIGEYIDLVSVLILRCPIPGCEAPVAGVASGGAASGGR